MEQSEPLRWLATEGRHLLQSMEASANARAATWQRLTDWQRTLLDEQSRIRQRVTHRFPDPSLWLWTERSVQQASDWNSAQFKANLLAPGQRVIDACCGAGADLVAMAHAHEVIGIDRDCGLLYLARSNARAHLVDARTAYCCGELPDSLGELSKVALHIDPDRRSINDQGIEERHTAGHSFSPSLESALELGERAVATIIKLAPATRIDGSIEQRGWRRCWLGTQRECPQQLLLRGELQLSIESGHTAAALTSLESTLPDTSQSGFAPIYQGTPDVSLAAVSEPLEAIYEPHPALYAAGLATTWSREHGLAALGQSRGYFTGRLCPTTPWSQQFQVIDHFGWDDRKLRKWLTQHDVGIVEFKCRLVQQDASALQRRYSREHGQPMTCLLTQIGRSVRAIMAKRMA